MKKLILIILICFTISCASSTQTVKVADYEIVEPDRIEEPIKEANWIEKNIFYILIELLIWRSIWI